MLSQAELVQSAIDSCYGDGQLQQGDFIVNTTGECAVVLEHQAGLDEVVKVPYPSVMAECFVRFEARVLEVLEDEATSPPPLEIPRIKEEGAQFKPPWFTMTRLPGISLPWGEAGSLSESDQSLLGSSVGRFAAWMARNIDAAQYKSISYYAGLGNDMSSVLINRVDFINKYSGGWGSNDWLLHNGYPALSNILAQNFYEYKSFLNQGLLDATIVGHDDLSASNSRFERSGDGLRPIGELDFGMVKPSTPERELRYMWALGEAAGNAAKSAYEAEMGVTLDERLLSFWAVAQCVTNAVSCVNRSSPPGGIAYLHLLGERLQRLVPDEDLSELQRDFNGREGLTKYSQLHPPHLTVFQPRRENQKFFEGVASAAEAANKTK